MKCINPAAYLATAPSQEFLASVFIVSFHFSVYIYVAGLYMDYYFALPV